MVFDLYASSSNHQHFLAAPLSTPMSSPDCGWDAPVRCVVADRNMGRGGWATLDWTRVRVIFADEDPDRGWGSAW